MVKDAKEEIEGNAQRKLPAVVISLAPNYCEGAYRLKHPINDPEQNSYIFQTAGSCEIRIVDV